MESKSSLVRAESRVELHPISPIDLDLPLVVFPSDTELYDTFWDGGNLKGFLVLGVLLEQ